MKVTDTHVYFWDGWLSNFHSCEIVRDNIKFSSSEQLFMYLKALEFEDYETAELIQKSTTPKGAKKLGRLIKNFNSERWDYIKEDIMQEVLLLKFSQNVVLKNRLLITEEKELVEASPFDTIWGVGLREDDPLILNESNWKGKNLLGECLMEIRLQLR